jgi:hypothetical protein
MDLTSANANEIAGLDNFRIAPPSSEVVHDVDPRATYLRAAHEESPGPAEAKKIELATAIPGTPVTAGDWLLLQRVGDFKFVEGTPAGFEGPHGDWTLRNLWGVFSGSDTLLPDDEARRSANKPDPIPVSDPDYSRVPDAIAVIEGNAVPIVTVDDPFPNPSPPPETLFQPSDIPEDFVIDIEGDLENPNPVLVRVPAGATHLFLGAGDVQWFDNSLTTDPGQFGIRIEKIEAGRLVGDYDLDGDVDGGDFLKWQRSFGSDDSMADGDLDGIVDADDLAIWQDHYGELVESAAAGTTVPEPGSLGLLLTMAALAYRRIGIQ